MRMRSRSAAAHMVLENMDRSVDPCHNFYEFACGGFEKRVVIPDDKSSRYIYTTFQRDIHDFFVLM
jgi:predicted metalloendopeptidase